MIAYPKIVTVWKRDPDNRYKTLLEGEWATPEFEYLKDNAWVFTEKVDGTNIRIMWDGQQVRYGGRTERAQMPTFLLKELQDMFSEAKLIEWFGDAEEPVCLYGEGYGARIQKGGGNYIPDGVSFILFDVLIGNWWLRHDDVKDIAQQLNIKVVPTVDIGPLAVGIQKVRDGLPSRLRDGFAEGLVMKPYIDLWHRRGGRIVTKIKHKDFNK